MCNVVIIFIIIILFLYKKLCLFIAHITLVKRFMRAKAFVISFHLKMPNMCLVGASGR